MGQLSAIDVAVMAATLLAVVAAGLLLGRKAGSADAFLAGERDLPWVALLLSIVAAETSSVTFLSVPGRAWAGDLRFLQLPLGYVIGRVVVARWLLPLYFEQRALTAYELLGRRFGPAVKKTTSLLFLATRTVADGLRLYLTALPLHALTKWPLSASIAVMALLSAGYSWFGGVRAVVWSDVAQFVVYLAGGIVALLVALGDLAGGDWIAGAGRVVDHAAELGKLRVLDLPTSLHDLLANSDGLAAGVLGGAFLTLASHGTDQMMVQRYLGARSGREAARALVVSGVVVLLQFALFLFLGLALHAWFAGHPTDAPLKGDELFGVFLRERLSLIPGVAGLLLGAIFAVSLSSSLSASASTLVNDWARPALGARLSDRGALRLARVATLVFALLQAAVALSCEALERSVVDVVLQIASFTSGLVLGLFFLAKLLGRLPDAADPPRRDRVAALAGFLAGLAGMTAIWRFTPLAWPWYALAGAAITVAAGGVASKLAR